MELNRRRYNLIIIALILIISAVAVFSAVELTKEDVSKPADNVIAEPIDPSEEDNNKSEVVVPDNKNYLPSAPSFSTGWKALNNAYAILDKYSYTSTISQTATNDPVLGITVTQLASKTKYKTANECLLIEKGICSSAEGVNYYGYNYMNEVENQVITRTTYNKSNNYTFTNEPVCNYTISDFKDLTGTTVKDSYFRLTSKNAELNSFSIVGSSYVLKLTLKNDAVNFTDMGKFITNGPAEVRDFKGISATFEIKINRKTGAFEEIKSTERYSVTKNTSFGWQNGTITSKITETFTFADINIDNKVASIVNK